MTNAPETIASLEAEHEVEHPHNDFLYMKVAAVLVVLTAIEVGLYYVDLSSVALMAFLYPIMVVKFATVAWWFMHLKFDSRLFRRLFAGGLALAVLVYVVVLLAFDEFL